MQLNPSFTCRHLLLPLPAQSSTRQKSTHFLPLFLNAWSMNVLLLFFLSYPSLFAPCVVAIYFRTLTRIELYSDLFASLGHYGTKWELSCCLPSSLSEEDDSSKNFLFCPSRLSVTPSPLLPLVAQAVKGILLFFLTLFFCTVRKGLTLSRNKSCYVCINYCKGSKKGQRNVPIFFPISDTCSCCSCTCVRRLFLDRRK